MVSEAPPRPDQRARAARALRQPPAVGYGLLAPAMVLVTGILVFPVIFGMYESLFETRRGRRLGFVGLGNYRELLGDADFWSSSLRSLGLRGRVCHGWNCVGTLFCGSADTGSPGGCVSCGAYR